MVDTNELNETIADLKKTMKVLSKEMDSANINDKDPYQRSRGVTFEINQLFLKFRRESSKIYKR
jgi:hypothetical protein